jgi:hypothetical protein
VVTVIECGIDELVYGLGGVEVARRITDRLEDRDRGLAPNPLVPGDESERVIDSPNDWRFGCRRSSFGVVARRPDSHRTTN